MKLYLAAPWEYRFFLPNLAMDAEARGHEITHRWWEHENDAPGGAAEDALADIDGVTACEALIVIQAMKSEGKAFETGLAFAYDKEIVVVGVRGNVFHNLIPCVESFSHALDLIEGKAR